jgi:hypothetical protein
MLRRLFIGLALGLAVGGLLAAGLIAGLKVPAFDGAGGVALAYAAAAVAGVLTGLVAGKPIWAPSAKVEAGLKAFFGALLGAGAMFALRQWASPWTADLSALGAGRGAVGALPATSLPLIAAVLGALFELDNTGGDATRKEPEPQGKRVEPQGANGANRRAKARVVDDDAGEPSATQEEPVSKRAKR